MKRTTFYITAILVLLAIAGATTVIDGTKTQADNGNFGNVSSNLINNIFYVTPNNGADIQLEINKCTDLGCTVVIPCGYYYLGGHIVIKNSNFELIGSGECTVINASNKRIDFNVTHRLNNIKLKNFKIVGDDSQSNAINIQTTPDGLHSNITIQDLDIRNFNASGISLNATDIYIIDNKIFNVHTGIVQLDIKDGSLSQNILINRNHIICYPYREGTEYGEGIEINNHGYGNAIVSNNYIEGCREEGIDMNAQYGIVNNNVIEISNLTSSGKSNGITVGNELVSGFYSINNNIIKNINIYGSGIEVVDRASISGNILIADTTDGTKKGSGIYITQSATVIITGNNFFNLTTGINNTGTFNSQIIGNYYEGVSRILYTNGYTRPYLIYDIQNMNEIRLSASNENQGQNNVDSGKLSFGEGYGTMQYHIWLDGQKNMLRFNTSGAGTTAQINRDSGKWDFITNVNITKNLTLTSPDGTAYNCGVANGGVLSCS